MTPQERINHILKEQYLAAQKLSDTADKSLPILQQLPEHILIHAACASDWLQLSNLTQFEAEEVRILISTENTTWDRVRFCRHTQTEDWEGVVDSLTIKLVGVKIDSNVGYGGKRSEGLEPQFISDPKVKFTQV